MVAAIVVRLPFCSSPAARPVLFRLWRGKGTASQVDLAAQMLSVAGSTWTTRLPANAVLHGPEPPRGRQARPPGGEGEAAGGLRWHRRADRVRRAGLLSRARYVHVSSCLRLEESLGARRYRVGPPGVRAVDTTGAGDCFNAGLLAGLAAGRDLPAATAPGCAAGAASTRAAGGTGRCPDLAQAPDLGRRVTVRPADSALA